ncbi:MAG: hypothetical protein M1823_004928 [Watsoniomyces obsoletus]|nr:MAG: hypothetical protein M1823_004928 [Watsoniomyces obsoletus]
MTEPEDLEEDLFADLYEGDEEAADPAPSAAPNTEQLPTDASNVAPISSTPGNPTQEEFNTTDYGDTTMQEEPRNGDMNDPVGANGQQDGSADDWGNGQATSHETNAVEQEPQAIGIKEDG